MVRGVDVRKTGVLLVAAFAAVIALGVGGGLFMQGDRSDVPPYELVEEEERNIVVEVEERPAGDGLRTIYDDIRTNRGPGGYTLTIRCSTGATLATGRFAVGTIGAAQTGLKSGEGELVTHKAWCP